MLKRKSQFCFLIVLLTAVGVSAQSFDLESFYLPAKALPQEFRDIDHLYLTGRRPAAVAGWIQLRSRARYKILAPRLAGRDFSFKTRRMAGVSYEFAGKFQRLENFSIAQPRGAVLRGILRKLKNGRVISASAVSFTYFVGD